MLSLLPLLCILSAAPAPPDAPAIDAAPAADTTAADTKAAGVTATPEGTNDGKAPADPGKTPPTPGAGDTKSGQQESERPTKLGELKQCTKDDGDRSECVGKVIWRLQRHTLHRAGHRFHWLTSKIREGRCRTALCWWPDNFWGLEILAEAPLGSSFAVHPTNLGGFLDNNGFTVQLTAGLRMWTLWDYISLSVYFSKLVFQSNDAAIRIPSYSYQHPASSVRRPYPGIAIGLLSDIVWIGFDYNVLYNGNNSHRDPHFPENTRIAGAWTVSIAFAPITLGRAVGAAVNRRKED